LTQSQNFSEEVSKSYIQKKPSSLKRWTKLLLRSKTGTVGFVIVFCVFLIALLAPILAPHDPALINAADMLKPPFWMEGGSTTNLLGTDNLGEIY